MRSLFLKIFLSYWVAQALFVVLAILITVAVRERGESATWDAQQSNVLSKAVQDFEHGGQAELRRYLDEVRESQHVRAYLLDEQGQDAGGRDLPHWAESLAKGITPPARDLWQKVMPSPFRRQSLTAASGHRYTLVAFLPPNGPFGPGGVPGLSILIGIVSSGLVCYLLSAIFDLAGGAPAGRDPAPGGGRSECQGRRSRRAGAATKWRNWFAILTPWPSGWKNR